MSIQADVFLDGVIAGVLQHDSDRNLFEFNYHPSWLDRPDAFPLSPKLPLTYAATTSPEVRSADVRGFFENLLPEGKALDDAAAASQVSKANTMGLLLSIAKETAGAISIGSNVHLETLRELPFQEISERIRARPYESFTIWDGKVRLSIAGFQDKISVLQLDENLYLAEGDRYASTHILKPEPIERVLAGMTSNEFFCMRLAERIGLAVAPVELVHIPEPILLIKRFDRELVDGKVRRLHYIDGCQALGISAANKYERPYGSERDVAHIRDGASYPRLFALLDAHAAAPVRERHKLLRWAIFQVLIGNVDAHAKNISFRMDRSGISIAPAYDLVSGISFREKRLDKSYAMAIGDAFGPNELCAYEWANFAHSCNIPAPLLSRLLLEETNRVLDVIDGVFDEAVNAGADASHVKEIVHHIKHECMLSLTLTTEVKKVDKRLFA